MKLVKLRNISIRSKFILFLCCLVALTGFSGYLANRSIKDINGQFSKIVDSNTPELVSLLLMRNAATAIEANLAEYSTVQALSSDLTSEEVTGVKNRLLASLESLQNARISYQIASEGSRTAGVADKQQDAELNEAVGAVLTQASHLASAREQNLAVAEIVPLQASLQTALRDMESIANRQLDSDILYLNHSNASVTQYAQQFVKTNIIASLATLGAILMLGILMTRLVKQLADEHTRLVSSANSLRLGFMLADEDNNIVYANPSLWKILNITAKDKITNTAQIQKKLDTNLDLQSLIKTCRDSQQPVDAAEITLSHKVLRVLISPVRDNEHGHNTSGIVMILEDVTEAKVMERSKDEFFSIASHELRTPLTSIKGNSTMILEYYKDALKDPELKEMVEDVHTSSVRLIEIVNDFLDLSRLEQGKMSFNYEASNIEKVIESVSYEMKQVLNEKGINLKLNKLTLNELPEVWVDTNRLKQVVYNLVGNAAKFTDSGGISISAKLDPGKKFVKVLVTDTGRGMTPESQQLLFRKFQQASSSLLTRDTTRGTGLGLYISKMIIENMGGVIALEESIEGKGSVFSFTLLVATATQKVVTQKSANVTDASTGLTTTEPVVATLPA